MSADFFADDILLKSWTTQAMDELNLPDLKDAKNTINVLALVFSLERMGIPVALVCAEGHLSAREGGVKWLSYFAQIQDKIISFDDGVFNRDDVSRNINEKMATNFKREFPKSRSLEFGDAAFSNCFFVEISSESQRESLERQHGLTKSAKHFVADFIGSKIQAHVIGVEIEQFMDQRGTLAPRKF